MCGSRLSSLVGVGRYRLFGLLPIIQWAQSLNDPATAPKDSQIRLIERLQVWSMILYYPLEHWCMSDLPRSEVARWRPAATDDGSLNARLATRN